MNTNHVLKMMIPLETARQVALDPTFTLRDGEPGVTCPDPGTEFEPPEKLHITLAFLGKHVTGEQRQAVTAVMNQVTREVGPIRIHLGLLRKFRIRWREVVWVAVDEPTEVLPLMRAKLVQGLTERGVKVDDTFDAHGWTPHVTLARGPHGLLQRVTRRHDAERTEVVCTSLTYKAGTENLELPLRGER